MFTWPVGPAKVSFYWPEAVLGNFLLAWGQQIIISARSGNNIIRKCFIKIDQKEMQYKFL